MFLHPFHLYPHLLRQDPSTAMMPSNAMMQWYHPPSGGERPFPPVPSPPADFASPIPVGGMVPLQSLVGMMEGGNSVCWDPMMGMYRATTGCPSGLFEQGSAGNGNTA
jgi:hypothetical protein